MNSVDESRVTVIPFLCSGRIPVCCPDRYLHFVWPLKQYDKQEKKQTVAFKKIYCQQEEKTEQYASREKDVLMNTS